MLPRFQMSMGQIVVFFLVTLGLLVGCGFLSQIYHLGLPGIILSQILAMLLPVLLWSKRKHTALIKAVGLVPWDLSAALAGIFFGIFWFFLLFLWINPLLERLFPVSQEQQKQMLLLLHPQNGFRPLPIDLLCIAWVPACCEEVLFRGALLPALASIDWKNRMLQKNRLWVALVVSSLLFGLFHLSFPKLLPTLLLGIGFGMAVILSRSLWAGIFMHAINNTLVLLLLRLGIENSNFSLRNKGLLSCGGVLFGMFGWLMLRFFIPHKKEQ